MTFGISKGTARSRRARSMPRAMPRYSGSSTARRLGLPPSKTIAYFEGDVSVVSTPAVRIANSSGRFDASQPPPEPKNDRWLVRLTFDGVSRRFPFQPRGRNSVPRPAVYQNAVAARTPAPRRSPDHPHPIHGIRHADFDRRPADRHAADSGLSAERSARAASMDPQPARNRVGGDRLVGCESHHRRFTGIRLGRHLD